MAKRTAIPFKELQLKVVGPTGGFLASRVQKFDVNSNLPSTDIDELGNNLHAGVTTGTPEVTATFSAMDVSVKIFSALTGYNNAAYPANGVSISALADIDLVGMVKDDKLADYVKSVHAKKLRISGFTYTYSVNGESTEEYTAQGTEKRWFKNDVVVDSFTSGSSFTLSQTPIVLKNGNYALSVIVDGAYLDEVASAPTDGFYSLAGTELTLGTAAVSSVVVIYHANPAGTNWSYISDSTMPAAIRGKNVPVYIGVNSIKRVQSVTLRGTFPTQKIEEMGNVNVVGYTSQVPQVTGDISVLDTDLELLSLLTTGSTSSADTEFGLCGFTASGLSLRIELQDPANGCTTASGTVLKTIYVPNITITSEGHSTSVGNNATQTYGFKSTTGDLIVYSGMMP